MSGITRIQGGESPNETSIDSARDSVGFSQMLLDSVRNVTEAQVSAEKAATDFATGAESKIHETMMQMQKADISLRTFVTVRNRVLEAYREVMRMGA